METLSAVKRFTTLVFALSLLTVPLLVAGCDGTGPDEGEVVSTESSFSFTVTGDNIETSLDGFAYFAEAPNPDGEGAGFALVVSEKENPDAIKRGGRNYTIGVFARGAGQPGTGTYSIAKIENISAAPPEDAFVAFISDGGEILFRSESGTIEVTASSDDRFAGRVTMEATAIYVDSGQETTVTIEGSFDARFDANAGFDDGNG